MSVDNTANIINQLLEHSCDIACVEGPVNHLWTVSALQLHPNSLIFCDDEATLELKVGTLRYFQQREAQPEI